MLKTQQQIDYLNFEVNVMRYLECEYLLTVINIIKREFEIILVLPFMEAGDLDHQMKQKRLQDSSYLLDENIVRFFATQILQGLLYLHKENLVHRDIKPLNIMMNKLCNLKIGDFGLCSKIEDGELLKTGCGTLPYMAPEIFTGKGYNKSVDVYAFGVVLYEMVCQERPYKPLNNRKMNFAKEFKFPERAVNKYSPALFDLITKILN